MESKKNGNQGESEVPSYQEEEDDLAVTKGCITWQQVGFVNNVHVFLSFPFYFRFFSCLFIRVFANRVILKRIHPTGACAGLQRRKLQSHLLRLLRDTGLAYVSLKFHKTIFCCDVKRDV